MSDVENDELFEAAYEYVRGVGGDYLVSLSEVLDHLTERFEGRFVVSPETNEVLSSIYAFWADPQIHDPGDGSIEFAWSEGLAERQSTREGSFFAPLKQSMQTSPENG